MLTWFAISGILTFIASSAMAIIMLAQREKFLHTLWGIFSVLVAFWGIGAYNIGLATDPDTALLWWKIAYIGVAFIPTMFTHFVVEFLEYQRLRRLVYALYVISFIYLLANLFTDFFIAGVHESVGGLYFMTPTPLYNTYMLMWILLVPYAHILLFREFLHVSGDRRQQIKLFFLASSIGFLGGSFSFLPEYHINIYPYPNIVVSLYPIIMGYAILKYRMWDFRVVATQVAVFLLWVFLAARAILAPYGSQEQLFNTILLGLTVLVGVLLIRSVNKEIAQRLMIEAQARELEGANREQEALLHFLSHEVKGYLAKGEAAFAAVIDGTYGTVSNALGEMAKLALGEMRTGVATVMGILDASNLKKGTVSYKKERFDFKKATEDVMKELRASAEEKGLEFSLTASDGNYEITGDEEKVRQHVIRNVIDNSIKYTPRGSVSVLLGAKNGHVRMVVEDTGVGISAEDMQKLFTEGGHGKDSIKINVHSTGFGLYIAKRIVEAHGGHISAESDGEGRGSRFVVDLP